MTATFEAFRHRSPRSLAFPPAAGSVAPLSRFFTWSLRAVCCAGLSVSGYLAFTALRSEDVAGCGGGALWDCGYALHSRWSRVFAVPVSVPAFVLYAVLLTSLSSRRPAVTRSRLRLAWGTITVGAIAAGLAAVWFIGLQVVAVGHLCVYCIAAHLCGLALCLAILWKQPLGARNTAMLSGVSVFGVSMLIAAQVLSASPPTFKIEHYPTDVRAANSSAATAPGHHASPQDKNRAPEVFEPPSGVPDDIAEK
jgi:uncharacterized membrane protein